MSDTFTSHFSTLKPHFALKIKVVPPAKSPNTLISTQEPADPSEAIRSSQTQISCFQMEQVHASEQVFEEGDWTKTTYMPWLPLFQIALNVCINLFRTDTYRVVVVHLWKKKVFKLFTRSMSALLRG